MLHISDIEKRLKLFPEPKEVMDMRNLITESFKNLEFFEGPHKYILHRENGEDIDLPSVSGVIHQFEQYVDWDSIRINKAKREGIEPEVLKRQWRENNILSTSNGTLTHEFGESAMQFFKGCFDDMIPHVKEKQFEDGYLIPYGKKEEAAAKLYEDMLPNGDVFAVMPEAKIYTGYNDSFKQKLSLKQYYSGTFDILMARRWKDGVIRPFLCDWKTNENLKNEFARKKGQMMLPPFDDMYDEPLSHYTLQLSAYSLGIEQLGLKPTHRIIIWLKKDGTYEKIPVPDVTEKLLKVL